MKRTGAWLVVRALEQIGVQFTFGIPGVHNTEIYDQLNTSDTITPILVTHEQCAAFAADAVSRTTDSIGCLVIVPAAGLTHAMSGIGEAYLDGIPLLVISGGVRRDSGRHYQLHQVDQQELARGVTKACWLVREHAEIVPAIYEAFETATSGEPGPVLVEVPTELQLFSGEVGQIPPYQRRWTPPAVDPEALEQAARLLSEASRPGIYLGWGAARATEQATRVAELLGAPVATTLQGLSVFPATHPLHVGMGFGPSAVPAAREAFAGCDCLLAVGCRFSELATGSYGLPVPPRLIHVDINPEVFCKNYPAEVTLEADAGDALAALAGALEHSGHQQPDAAALEQTIRDEKQAFQDHWTSKPSDRLVSPGIFFRELRARLDDEAYLVVDDGNHTFLSEEQFPVHRSRHFISPTDFNCMGYSVPAAVGTKLTHPDRQVVTITGDGAFLMTGMELLTASIHGLGVIVCVFHDGELGQIAQFQQLPLARKTCTVLGEIKLEGMAIATGAAYLAMEDDSRVGPVLDEALATAGEGRPVIVDVNIDYSRKTEFTRGVVKVNLSRFPLGEKVRFIGRAAVRHILG